MWGRGYGNRGVGGGEVKGVGEGGTGIGVWGKGVREQGCGGGRLRV